jgi:hypothetical protein
MAILRVLAVLAAARMRMQPDRRTEALSFEAAYAQSGIP